MRRLEATIVIDAPPERVWGALMDFDSMPEWNPFIREISGTPSEDERLRVRLEPPGGKGMTFKPTVLRCEPNREFRWLGHLLVPGVFDGEHYFLLEPSGGGTRFIQGEEFRGVFVGMLDFLFGGMLDKAEAGFQRMNEALKARVEGGTDQPAADSGP